MGVRLMKTLTVLIAGLSVGCVAVTKNQLQNEPDLEHVTSLERSVSTGWPFRVTAAVGDYDAPESFVSTIREEFLRPLAKAPFANQIRQVTIDARSPIYGSWSCRIDLHDGLIPIILRDSTPFYKVESAHPYREALQEIRSSFRTRNYTRLPK